MFKKINKDISSYSSLRFIFSTCSKKTKFLLITAITIALISALTDFYLLTNLFPFLEELSQSDLNNIKNISGGKTLILLALISIFFRVSTSFLCFFSINKVGIDLKYKAFRDSITANIDEYFTFGNPLIQTALTTHMERSIVHILGGFINASVGILTSIIIIYAICISTGFQGLFFLICLGFIYISVFIGTRYSFNKSGKKVREATENLEFIISESIYNYRETLSQLNHNLIFKNYLQEAQKARYNTAIVNSLRVLPRNVIEGGLIIILVSATILNTNSIQNIIPTLGVIAVAAQRLLPFIQYIFAFFTNLSAYKFGINQIIEITRSRKDIGIVYKDKELVNLKSKLKIKDLELKKVSIIKGKKFIVRNLDFKFEQGFSYCLIGKSGSGKSSLLDIIIGLTKPTHGFLEVNKKVMQYKKEFLYKYRKSIYYVPQRHVPSPIAVIDYLKFGCKKNTDQLTKICKELYCQQLLYKKCTDLSGGEMQRVSLTKALLNDPNVLILDESTSAMDEELEFKVLNYLLQSFRNKLIISVSHRPSTFKLYDKILNLEEFSKD